jgi:hypothetical protein
MGTENKEQPARNIDFKAKSRGMLEDAYAIAASSFTQARALTDKKEKHGVAGWMHIAEKAMGEIVRLTPMCGVLESETAATGQTVGYHHDPEKEKNMLAFVPDA